VPGPVREALRELPRTERIAFLLRRDGLTAPETAAELNPHVPFCERFRWAALRAVACGAVTLRESGDLRLGRLWSGEPPDGGGRATLLTVDGAAPGAAPGTLRPDLRRRAHPGRAGRDEQRHGVVAHDDGRSAVVAVAQTLASGGGGGPGHHPPQSGRGAGRARERPRPAGRGARAGGAGSAHRR